MTVEATQAREKAIDSLSWAHTALSDPGAVEELGELANATDQIDYALDKICDALRLMKAHHEPFRIRIIPERMRHPYYVVRTLTGRMYLTDERGTPHSWSTIAEGGTSLMFALEDAENAEEALAAVKAHCWTRYANGAEIL